MRFYLLLLPFLFFACNTNNKPPQKVAFPSFYAWKTTFKNDAFQAKTLEDYEVKRLYIKYADIDFREGKGAIPVSKTDLNFDSFPKKIAIIPVFFIVNRVFLKINESESDSLARSILRYFDAVTPMNYTVPEIQIDCDWSEKTRDAYFLFLKQIKAQLNQFPKGEIPILSATIRLHQVKYRKNSGIPPVDRGMLMLYNFESPSKKELHNSIISTSAAAQYLPQKNPSPFSRPPSTVLRQPSSVSRQPSSVYPLPLDAALPLFAWGLHFKDQELKSFIHDFRKVNADSCTFLKCVCENIFRVKSDTSCFASYFRTGDWVRTESAKFETISEVWDLAKPVIPNDTCHLVFFDLNEKNLKFYQYEELSKLFKNSN
jgi:hypothetical protein